ncbi:uncharacterized protein EI90DRAFT_3019992 [Cantharellus anzutake]|uniref:uncharacterized protein n=1 Tax=Cantharellus anzutake TaxID=1750568 RepID=UPI0019067F48|nr:uncharacterized protein EI90DRAFT_3019992 [Cantharellus anzutake]KAF8322831.1 hypothetical protein EI90DRAFT_3019992 [Cantharellus anzutake]
MSFDSLDPFCGSIVAVSAEALESDTTNHNLRWGDYFIKFGDPSLLYEAKTQRDDPDAPIIPKVITHFTHDYVAYLVSEFIDAPTIGTWLECTNPSQHALGYCAVANALDWLRRVPAPPDATARMEKSVFIQADPTVGNFLVVSERIVLIDFEDVSLLPESFFSYMMNTTNGFVEKVAKYFPGERFHNLPTMQAANIRPLLWPTVHHHAEFAKQDDATLHAEMALAVILIFISGLRPREWPKSSVQQRPKSENIIWPGVH